MGFAETRGATSGRDTLKYLRDILKQNRERLDVVDAGFKKAISSPTPAQPKDKLANEKALKALSDERKELVLRQEFLDRLVFRIDTRFLGGDLQDFLIRQITDMAVIEASDPQGDSNLWKFLTSLAIALRDQIERSEHLAYFIEGYMKFSTILKPIRPQDYVKVRSYSNGQDYYAAKGVPKELLGEAVERRLRNLPTATPAGTLSTKVIRQD